MQAVVGVPLALPVRIARSRTLRLGRETAIQSHGPHSGPYGNALRIVGHGNHLDKVSKCQRKPLPERAGKSLGSGYLAAGKMGLPSPFQAC